MRTLVIGGRGFGKHAVRILSGKGYDVLASSTTDAGVEELNATHADNPRVEAVKIRASAQGGFVSQTKEDLDDVLDEQGIEFVYDASQDRTWGDLIHAFHAEVCLAREIPFLAEKPVCNTDELGRQQFQRMKKWGRNEAYTRLDGGFGVQLPFAVIAEELKRNEMYTGLVKGSERITFYWATRTPASERTTDVGIRDNLFPHTVPSFFVDDLIIDSGDVRHTSTEKGETVSFIAFEDGPNPGRGRRKAVEVTVRMEYGGNFTGICFDDSQILAVKREGADNDTIIMAGTERDMFVMDNAGLTVRDGLKLCPTIRNPLEINLQRSIEGRPTVPYAKAIKVQYMMQDVKP